MRDYSPQIVNAAKKIVVEMDKRDMNAYVSLAKVALWAVGVVITIVGTTALCSGNYAVAVSACQVMVMLAVSVLGFHEYKGSRVFHLVRHWNDEKDSPQDTEQ